MSVRGKARYGDRVRLGARAAPRDIAHDCTEAELAWVAAMPCALVVITAVALLGPPLGSALFAPSGMLFWPYLQHAVLPEPTEHARYVLSLLGPVLLSALLVLAARWRTLPTWPQALAVLVPLGQTLLVAAVVAAVWIQETTWFGTPYYETGGPRHNAYFTVSTLLCAAVIAALLALTLARPHVRRRMATVLSDTPGRRAMAIAAAVTLIALWLLAAVNSDDTIGVANRAVATNLGNWLDESIAVLDQQAPLVHLRAQYGQLWPYASAAVMAALGSSVGIFVGTMLAGTAAAMLAVLALLRRLARSWLAALVLFVPFLATSFFIARGPLDNRYSPAQLFSLFPMRYGGPYVLAWLTVRHLDGSRPRQRLLLFAAGGLVTINNVEFGLPALGATLAAVAWTEHLTLRSARRLARDVALGLLAAVAGVAALTLAVEGALPRFGLALTFSRIFAVEGFGLLPMKAIGLHLVLYATFAAAIVVATTRALRSRDRADAPLTGMLAWIGVFGLGVGSYFVGRSHPEVLIDLFSPWALALLLLLVAVVRSAAAQARWRPSLPELAVLFGVGLAACSIAQVPTPWSQVRRLGHTSPFPVFHPIATERAIAPHVQRGEPVAIILPVGHRIANDIGVVDVTPYSDPTLPARRQLSDTIAALRAAGGHQLFLALWLPHRYQLAALQAAGFRLTDVIEEEQLAILVDTRPRP